MIAILELFLILEYCKELKSDKYRPRDTNSAWRELLLDVCSQGLWGQLDLLVVGFLRHTGMYRDNPHERHFLIVTCFYRCSSMNTSMCQITEENTREVQCDNIPVLRQLGEIAESEKGVGT